MKILFLTKSYSKNQGGKEIYNYNLVKGLKDLSELELIATTGSMLKLLWFYPYSLVKGMYLCSKRKITHIHLGTNFMLPVGIILKKLYKCKLSLTLYGLELTYPNKLYQTLFVKPIKNCDKLISISSATTEQAIKAGLNKDKIKIIPCGVYTNEFKLNENKKDLIEKIEKQYNVNLKNKKILITVGRLVKRKGVEWFVSNVMSKLSKKYVYLIPGEGPEKENIINSIKKNKLEDRVFLLGRVSFETLKILYNISDKFIMPNIKVEGDMEGFGIVLIEAGSCGVPAVASKLEGIQDAVINGKTGWFVKEKNVNDFVKRIQEDKFNKETIMKTIKSKFSWESVCKEYLEVLK